MVNYNNAKVYKIWSTAGDKIYIGSTTKEYLSQRMDTHRSGYKRWKNEKHGLITSFKLFEEYGLENCFIELLEAKVCTSKDELIQLEGGYVRSMKCVNKCIPGRTDQQYRDDNKDKINEQINAYREDNKDKIKAYREEHKEESKQYREDNKDKIKEQKREYREINKAKLCEQFECECGGRYTYRNKATHLKSIKHCQFIESQQQPM